MNSHFVQIALSERLDYRMERPTDEAIVGCLLGTAVGDAIGLPSEGLSARRQRRLFSTVDSHRLLLGRGMVSDDTEHTCVLANALIASGGDEAAFQREFARGLRRWVLTLPAGAGLATLRATIKLCLGFGPQHSGVFSAGNGPAMRSALIGVCYGWDQMRMRRLVSISARMTHTDPKAEHSALSVAIAGDQSKRGTADPSHFYEALGAHLADSRGEYWKAIEGVVTSVTAGVSTIEYAEQFNSGRGPSGYCMQSVPVALHAWLRHPANYRAAVTEAVHCGGDTDTTAAIVGAIVGARVGPEGIPQEWRGGILEWPRSLKWIAAQGTRLSAVVTSRTRGEKMELPLLPLLLRNGVFAAVVVAHGLRRWLPPY